MQVQPWSLCEAMLQKRKFWTQGMYPSRIQYRGAVKSLARPGMKKDTSTKLQLLQASQKKFIMLSVQPALRGSNDLRVGQKMANFQLFLQLGWAKNLSAPL